MISAIIVAYNEEDLIEVIIKELKKQQFIGDSEIILADGGSEDNTVLLAEQNNIKIVNCRKGKSRQMNDAAKRANGDIVFFVHADMQFSDQVFSIIQEKVDEGFDGGGFDR